MGAAQTKNVATAITNVSNFVDSSTVANNAQASVVKSKTVWRVLDLSME